MLLNVRSNPAISARAVAFRKTCLCPTTEKVGKPSPFKSGNYKRQVTFLQSVISVK